MKAKILKQRLNFGTASFLLLGLALAWAACRQEPQTAPAAEAEAAPGTGGEEMALRAYQVPEPAAPQVLSLLRTILQPGGESGEGAAGRVDMAPGGRIVVLAPAQIQSGIERLLGELSLSQAQVPPPVTYEADHWLVLGVPAEATTVPDSLGEIGTALQAIASSQGSMRFAPLERLHIRSMEHEQAEISGVHASVRQALARQDGQLLAELDVSSAGGSGWHTRLSIPEGELVVLAQVGFQDRLPGDPFAAAYGAPAGPPQGPPPQGMPPQGPPAQGMALEMQPQRPPQEPSPQGTPEGMPPEGPGPQGPPPEGMPQGPPPGPEGPGAPMLPPPMMWESPPGTTLYHVFRIHEEEASGAAETTGTAP